MRIPFSQPTIAHRGAGALAPENTLAAYQAAAHLGAPMIEVDTWRTTDGKLVIMHDDTVDRTTNGKGRIDSMSFDQVRQLDAGSWFAPRFSGAQVPTLAEVLCFARGKMKVDIHVREADNYPGLEKDIATAIREQKAENDVLVTAFEPRFLSKFKQIAPEIATGTLLDVHPMLASVKRGLTAGAALGAILGFSTAGLPGAVLASVVGAAVGLLTAREGALTSVRRQVSQSETDVILPFWAQCDRRLVEQAHKRDQQVIPYVVNAPPLAHWLVRQGADAYVTDNAERFLQPT